MCGLQIELHDGQITSIRGDEADPFSKGYICPKATALQDLHEDPDRLRQPVRRNGTGWQKISWDEALDETASRLHEIQEKHGRDAVGIYVGNPNVHNLSTVMLAPLFLKTLRTKNRFSATSVDQLPHMLASYLMFGHQFLFAVPDIDRTDYMVILGGNPLASNGSLMTAPGVRDRLKAIQKRGGRFIVIDPRRSETAKIADEHHFIRPGTDALFLLGLLNEMFKIGARLREFEGRAQGLGELKEIAARFPSQRSEQITGISATETARLAKEFMNAPSAAFYGRLGAHTQEFGGLTAWLIHCINVVSGNLNRPGGTMFTLPAVDILQPLGGLGLGAGSFGRWKSRVRGKREFGGELPVGVLAEEILTEGPGQIRALLTSAGNPVLSTPNGRQVERALGKLDFMVSLDMYINESTVHADIILPPISPLEREHYDLALNLVSVRNTSKYSLPLFKPAKDARTDGQVLLALVERIERLRGGALSKGRLRAKALQKIGVERLLDLGLRFGPYGRAAGLGGGVSVSKLKKNPHGIDLGPLTPLEPGRLPYRREHIDLAPKDFVQDLERLEKRHLAKDGSARDIILIGRRQLRSNNSWMHNSARLMRGKDRCTLMMNPTDAERLGLAGAERVVVASSVGEVDAPPEITDEVMPGVVSLPHGFGHGREGVQLSVAREKPGVSVNDLTDDQLLDELSGNAALSGVSVKVRRAEAIQAAE